jgi:hypothetical protein
MRASIRVSMSMAREKAMTLMSIGCEMNWGLRELKSRETFLCRCIRGGVPRLIYRLQGQKNWRLR